MDYPEVARNLIVHEAALQSDVPIEGIGLIAVKGGLPFCTIFLK